MASPNLAWTINLGRGTVSFGRLVPFAGNTYDFTLEGGADGQTYTAFVMDDAGLKCLAKSTCQAGQYSIAFNGRDLREEFTREMHEIRSFHVIVRDSEKTVAEADLPIAWNPLWADAETGEVYTMKGDKGERGETGARGADGADGRSAYECAQAAGFTGTQEEWLNSLRGPAGQTTAVKCPADNKWYPLAIEDNGQGEMVVSVSQTGEEWNPDTLPYVSRTEEQTVRGRKHFADGATATAPAAVNPDPAAVATAAWTAECAAQKAAAIKAADNVWTGANTFNAAPAILAQNNAAEQTVRTVNDPITGAPHLTDTLQRVDSGDWTAKIGRLARTVAGAIRQCCIRLAIGQDGRRTIDLSQADQTTAPTPPAGDNSACIATTAFVADAIAAIPATGKLRGVYHLTDIPTAGKTYNLQGFTPDKPYRRIYLWNNPSKTTCYLKIGGAAPETFGYGLNANIGTIAATGYGFIGITLATTSTSYLTSAVVFIFET